MVVAGGAPMTPDLEVMHAPDVQALVAAELRAAAARRNLTQAAIAERLGVDYMWVNRRLNGITHVTVPDLIILCEAIGAHALDVLAQTLIEREGC